MWYNCLSKALSRNGFCKSIHDQALFMTTNEQKTTMWCLVCIDDILMASSTKEEIEKCIAQLQKEFTLAIVHDISQFLRMNVMYDMDKGELTIKAKKYIENLEMRNYTTVRTMERILKYVVQTISLALSMGEQTRTKSFEDITMHPLGKCYKRRPTLLIWVDIHHWRMHILIACNGQGRTYGCKGSFCTSYTLACLTQRHGDTTT